MLSREFFYQLEDELTRARYEIDEAFQMSQELRYGKDIIQPIGKAAMTTPLDRLKGKFLQARGVVGRVASNMESEADSLIAQEDEMKAKTASAFAPHKAILAEASSELQAIEDALSLVSNGGPSLDPLPASGDTEQG
jgi:hypothetical protein